MCACESVYLCMSLCASVCVYMRVRVSIYKGLFLNLSACVSVSV